MAKRTKTTTVEESEDTPEVNYTEDIQGKSLQQVSEESKKEEEVKPEVKEEEPKPEPEPTPEPEIDLEENNRKIAEETAKRVREEIAESLKGSTPAETKTNKDEYAEWVEDFTKQNGREPQYTDAFDFLENRALARLEAKQNEARAKEAEAIKQAVDAENAELQKFGTELNEGFADLYRSNKLPRIKDPNDASDIGVQHQKALLETMQRVNVERVSKGQLPIRDIVRIHSIYFKPPTRQPAGADAMLRSNSSGPTGDDSEQEIDYMRDVRGKSWKSFFRR